MREGRGSQVAEGPPGGWRVRRLAEDLLAGGVASSVSKTAVAPLERIKLILQTQEAAAHIAAGSRYAGIWDTVARLPREQGLLAMWRGNWANVLRNFPTQALNLAFNDRFQALFLARMEAPSFWGVYAANVAAGGAAGAASLALLYPLDFCRTRLALDMGTSRQTRQFRGLVDCMRQVCRSEGVRGLYAGFGPSIVLAVVYRAAHFGSYHTAKQRLLRPDSTVWERYLVAQVVTTAAGLLAYPLDTVRRRLILGSFGHERRLYSSAWDCFRKSCNEGGFRGLYNGATANILRGASGAVVLVMYDQVQAHLNLT